MKGGVLMREKQMYAVVDIETTGTDPLTDRIIQFGCVLIKNGEIVSRFATDINPNQAISKQIQGLTGISNTRVQKAPYFEDVALTIYNLLADTIFVAHNIYFDYAFLSHELVRCGAPKLKIPGIDTVELAQVFLPTEKSFRLNDLAESLGLVHDNPHQADSDAQVTAELLLLIERKMYQLPLVTMEKITKLSHKLGMNTHDYISDIYEEMKNDIQPLSDQLKVVDGLVLRKKEVPLFQQQLYGGKNTFPKSKKAKQKRFSETIGYRAEQSKMMNLVYQHFTEDENKDLFIEAATGTGKTLGYLFPLSYLATPENPVVISTVSIVLQNQLLEKDIALANQVCEKKLHATVVKSHRHYLDLQRFKATLNFSNKAKQYVLYQMGVLVWLLETQTGDLDELQLTTLEHPFWYDVIHRGTAFLSEKGALYKEDFLRFLHKNIKQSNVLIVNHAFLSQETLREVPLLPKSSFLIIDEAHHLPDIAGRISSKQFNYFTFKKQVSLLQEKEQLFDKVSTSLKSYPEETRLVRIYDQSLNEVVEEFSDFFFELRQLFSSSQTRRFGEERLVEKELFDGLSIEGEILIQKIESLFSDMLQMQQRIQQIIERNLETFSVNERITFVRLLRFFETVQQVIDCFDIFVNDWQPCWVKEYLENKQGQVTLKVNNLEASILSSTLWYQRYEKILYTGGTLKFGKNKHYLSDKLGLTDVVFKTILDPYDYEDNARLFLPTESINIQESNPHELAQYIASVIREISDQEERPILVLFTSHESLANVYHKLQPDMLNRGREILAQGITGGREKLLKRFFHSKDSILLGADSFWEGVDLPGDALQILIVTRLPFENPKRPFVKARYNYLEDKGIDPFGQEALPKATLRLRQALGRLIRSRQDKGVLIVLDKRLVTAKYGKKMQRALPKNLPIKEIPFSEMLLELKEFLKK
ncbi:helicase C-terminal domain-containing protein [Enterococcus rivorum]|nr:helicase C-terminal domain-containing protein [Enterococcus rivorum]